MLVWFVVMAALGVYGVAQHPSVLAAINPLYGLEFLVSGGMTGFLVLGGVFLCVTGAEALYADMGHFGPDADPPRLERRGVPEPRHQLRRASRAGSRRRADRRQHLLSPVPRPAAHAPDRAGDDRDDHRQPIDHHRRLFDDAPGHPARLAAAPHHQADVGGGLRPDLRRGRQLAADDRHARPDDRLRQVGQSRRRLRHRGFADDADDERAAVHRDARNLGLGRRRAPARSPRCS